MGDSLTATMRGTNRRQQKTKRAQTERLPMKNKNTQPLPASTLFTRMYASLTGRIKVYTDALATATDPSVQADLTHVIESDLRRHTHIMNQLRGWVIEEEASVDIYGLPAYKNEASSEGSDQ